MPNLKKLNLDFWLIFASYCNKFFQICHPNIFNSITSGVLGIYGWYYLAEQTLECKKMDDFRLFPDMQWNQDYSESKKNAQGSSILKWSRFCNHLRLWICLVLSQKPHQICWHPCPYELLVLVKVNKYFVIQ